MVTLKKLNKMDKFKIIGEGKARQYWFDCPGCDDVHAINDTWEFNGDLENPTVSPSILAEGYSYKTKTDFKCHSYIKAGKIQFLSDCTHELAGQTVELPKINKQSWLSNRT